MTEIILSGRLNGIQRNKLKGLFDMLYTPRELAQELDIPKNQIYRVYVPMGCPNTRDNRNHILINGKEFKDWYFGHYRKVKLGKNEAFCKTCRKAVPISGPEKLEKNGITYLISACPECGRRLAKIVANSRRKNDQ